MYYGDIVFVSGTDWISRVIKWVTKSKYSHVAVYVGSGKLIEAQGFRRVGFQELSAYAGEFDTVPLPRSVTNDGLERGLHWILLQRGRRYSYWSDVVILIRCLFKIKIPWHEGRAIMCARLARDFLFQCGLPVPDYVMDPEDLYEWLKAH